MRLLAPALLAIALSQQAPADPKPAWRRTLTLVNPDDAPFPAGAQVALRLEKRTGNPADASDVDVRHRGKSIATWSNGAWVWFRTVAEIARQEGDAGYEVRYGGGAVPRRPAEIFEYFDEPSGDVPDPKRWVVDPGLGLQVGAKGIGVTDLPSKRTEFNPASLIIRHSPLPEAFSIDADLQWAVSPEAAFSFALRVEIDEEIKAPDDVRARCADLIKKLGDDDIAARDAAVMDLVKVGRAAVAQLGEAALSPEAEVGVRARKAIELIHKEFPPQMIQTGFSTGAEAGSHLVQASMLGRARSELSKDLLETSSASISIHRAPGGYTRIEWARVHWPKGAKVPGKIGRIRFDFWGEKGGRIGSVTIRRVVVRRPVETMPGVAFGAEEAIR